MVSARAGWQHAPGPPAARPGCPRSRAHDPGQKRPAPTELRTIRRRATVASAAQPKTSRSRLGAPSEISRNLAALHQSIQVSFNQDRGAYMGLGLRLWVAFVHELLNPLCTLPTLWHLRRVWCEARGHVSDNLARAHIRRHHLQLRAGNRGAARVEGRPCATKCVDGTGTHARAWGEAFTAELKLAALSAPS